MHFVWYYLCARPSIPHSMNTEGSDTMTIRKHLLTGATALLALSSLFSTPAGFAQVESGRFVGRVADPQDAVVANASVTARNVETNVTQTAVTDGNGNFVITPVAAGNYVLSVTAPGFETTATSSVEVQVGQIVREDLKLLIGSSTTTVEVHTTTPLLNTDSATVGTVITNRQLTDLPLNGRGFFRLAELTPGAALLPPTGNSLAIRPEVVNGNVISGIRGSATSFLLDGVDVSEQHQGGTFIQTSIDALQEFSIQQSPYSAEYNRGGAFFNATTKSGTNRFHGGIFEFIRNDKLDARNYFALTRQILKRNQFGGDLGGPLSIPHLYNGAGPHLLLRRTTRASASARASSSTASFPAWRSAAATSAPRPSTIPPRPAPSPPPTTATHPQLPSAPSSARPSSTTPSPPAACPRRPSPSRPTYPPPTRAAAPSARSLRRRSTSTSTPSGSITTSTAKPPLRPLDLRHESRIRSQRLPRAQDRLPHLHRPGHRRRRHHQHRRQQGQRGSRPLSPQPRPPHRLPPGSGLQRAVRRHRPLRPASPRHGRLLPGLLLERIQLPPGLRLRSAAQVPGPQSRRRNRKLHHPQGPPVAQIRRPLPLLPVARLRQPDLRRPIQLQRQCLRRRLRRLPPRLPVLRLPRLPRRQLRRSADLQAGLLSGRHSRQRPAHHQRRPPLRVFALAQRLQGPGRHLRSHPVQARHRLRLW